jgi:hypothetical protein
VSENYTDSIFSLGEDFELFPKKRIVFDRGIISLTTVAPMSKNDVGENE